MKYYVLFGPPGAGKGTQAAAMVEKYKLCHISTGDLLRKEIAEGTELGKQAKALIDFGNLVPDEIVEGMIESVFNKNQHVNGFILDGFPRTLAQAEVLDKMLSRKGEQVTSTISIMIPDRMIIERIKSRASIEGRSDDADESIIRTRINNYHRQTEPIIGYYTAEGLYHQIDGTGSVEDVRERVFKLIDNQ